MSGAIVRLHIDPYTQIDHRLLLCEVAHGIAKELRARVYGLFGFQDAGHRVNITDDASALRMLFFVTRREMTDVSVVRWGPSIIVIRLME